MALSIKNDSRMPDGGYAVLTAPGLEGVSALSVENCFSGMFLGEDGGWSKMPFACPVESIEGQPNAVSLGPHIVDFVPTDLQVSFRTEAGQDLGKVFWADIIPSRNPGLITSAKVLEDRAKRGAKVVESPKLPEPEPPERDLVKADPITPHPVKAPDLIAPDPPWPKPKPVFPTRIVVLVIVVIAIAGASFYWWSRPTRTAPKHPAPSPRHHHKPHRSPSPPLIPPPLIPPPLVPPPLVPRPLVPPPLVPPPLGSDNCPTKPADAYDQGLQKLASDDPKDLLESERLLICASKAGVPKAKSKLGRLYLKMATAMGGSFDQKRAFYKKACDIGDPEGCEKYDLRLDR